MDTLPPSTAQTLIPPALTASASPKGRRVGRAFAFGLTPRALFLFAAAALLSIPAFFHAHRIWLMWSADALVLGIVLLDAILLPAPERLRITRQFLHTPELDRPLEIRYTIETSADAILTVSIADDLHPSLSSEPAKLKLSVLAREPASGDVTCHPRRRGDCLLGRCFLRYRGVLGLVDRWAVAELQQPIRVYAAGEEANDSTQLYLLRARQIELQKRRLRVIGLGREFDSMRDYQPGDELRNISWKATARHSHLITQQFTTERSQQVWILLDAGRLSRTSLILPGSHSEGTDTAGYDRSVTQLDQAASAAGMLARVIAGSGDKSALLTYGRTIQQQVLPGSGAVHLRQMVEALSQVRSDSVEADHMYAAARLRHLQRKRGIVLWITEMTDTAGRPDIVAAAANLVRRHLVVLVLLHHDEVTALAAQPPANVRGMYRSTAAQEMLERRREHIRALQQKGILILETTPDRIGADAIARYLELKAKGTL